MKDTKTILVGENFIAADSQIQSSFLQNSVVENGANVKNCKLIDVIVAQNTSISNLEISGGEVKNFDFDRQIPQLKFFKSGSVRGIFGKQFTLDLVWEIGKSLCFLGCKRVVIGYDTRPTSAEILQLLKVCFEDFGVEVLDVGVIPTPGLIFLTKQLAADFGIMITASHNPENYNGVKIFKSGGQFLTYEDKVEIEKNMFINQKLTKNSQKIVKKPQKTAFFLKKYVNFIKSFDNSTFENIKIVVDCANGCASLVAPKLFKSLRAEVIAINTNSEINGGCGAVFPNGLAGEVVKNHADLGFAFDGDADRIIAVNHRGEILNGDDLLCVLAWYFKHTNPDFGGVCGTVLTNLGIENKLKAMGVNLEKSPVGTYNIASCMGQKNLKIGGESSGHILINHGNFISSDALFVARILLSIYKVNRHIFESVKENRYIQIQKNLTIPEGDENVLERPQIVKIIKFFENKLVNFGRVIVRQSQTEPKVRIMVESMNKNISALFANEIKRQIISALREK